MPCPTPILHLGCLFSFRNTGSLAAPAATQLLGGLAAIDFMRCVKLINAKIEEHGNKPLPDHEIKGLCAILHKKATGATPGNAPGERAAGTAKGKH
jgi:hypothetical protein